MTVHAIPRCELSAPRSLGHVACPVEACQGAFAVGSVAVPVSYTACGLIIGAMERNRMIHDTWALGQVMS